MEDVSLNQLFGPDESEKAQKSSRLASVMIIDDNQDVLDGLIDILQDHYRLLPCLSYEEAQHKLDHQIQQGGLHQNSLPIVLLDIKMAYKDGVEAFRLLKEGHPDLKIIFHSAYPGTDIHAKEIKNLPHAGYLTKGKYTISELIHSIQSALK